MLNPSEKKRAREMALANLAAMTDEEDAAITRAARADPDAQPAADLLRRKRGRPVAAETKTKVSFRLSPDVLAALRASGPGWQTRADAMLRKALGLS